MFKESGKKYPNSKMRVIHKSHCHFAYKLLLKKEILGGGSLKDPKKAWADIWTLPYHYVIDCTHVHQTKQEQPYALNSRAIWHNCMFLSS